MKRLVSVVSILLLVAGLAISHSGRTDARGGHRNTKTGTYHCHTCSSTVTRPKAVTPKTTTIRKTTPKVIENKTSVCVDNLVVKVFDKNFNLTRSLSVESYVGESDIKFENDKIIFYSYINGKTKEIRLSLDTPFVIFNDCGKNWR